jgi:radical SAM superfamily enzyme YgiQ (UPF0313 family)
MNKKGRIALIGAEDEENLAIRYLGAVLVENQHQVKIVPCSSHADISKAINEVKSFRPQLIGVSLNFQSLALIFLELIQHLKEELPDVHITVGGHFPTFEYSKLLENYPIDSVIRFEGEKSIALLINNLLNEKKFSNIPNLVYRDVSNDNIIINPSDTHFPDLDKIPFPLRNKKAHVRLGENFATLVASRGCFHSHCIYCCIGAFHQAKVGDKYALRNPENIAREMGGLYHEKKGRLFQFHDDSFLLNSSDTSLRRLKELKVQMEKKNIELDEIGILVKIRPEELNNDILDVLEDLGTIGIFLGVENASNPGLKALGRGSHREDIDHSLELLKDYKMGVTFNLLMFHPKATLEEINENIFFMKENNSYAYDFGRAEIVAGSPLETLVRRKKLIKGQWPRWNYKIEDDAVEKMFRLNLLTFHHENSAYSDLTHQMIALSYRSHLIQRLYPGKESSRIHISVLDLIKSFNEFNLEKLLDIYHLTAEDHISKGLDEINSQLQENYPQFIKESQSITNKMNKLQILEKQFKEQGLDNYLQNSGFWKKVFRI